jgi:hypothetical protein
VPPQQDADDPPASVVVADASAVAAVTAAAAAAAVLAASVQRAHLSHLTLDAIGSVEPLVRQSLIDEEDAARETLQLRRLVVAMQMQQHRAAEADSARADAVARLSAAGPSDDGATGAALSRAVTMLERSHRDAIVAAALVAASQLGHDMILFAESAHRDAMGVAAAAAAAAFMLAVPSEDEDRLLPGDGGSTARPHSSARSVNDAATDATGGDAPPQNGLEATKRFLSYDDVSSGGAGTCSDVEWDEHSSVSSTASIRPDRTAWV